MRGRGIASRLVDAALAQMRANGARRIYLQVRHDNAVAHTLYTRRGFSVYDTIHEWGLRPSAWPLAIGGAPGLHPMRWWRSQSLVALARQAVVPGRLAAHPRLLAHYRRGFWQALASVFDIAESNHELAATESGRMIAWGRLRGPSPRLPAEMELLVHPEHRGPWEAALATMLLARHYPQRRQVRAHVSATHPEASQALDHLGFELLRVLDEMALAL
jgi:GNAT superfamily N-acetyltransferase